MKFRFIIPVKVEPVNDGTGHWWSRETDIVFHVEAEDVNEAEASVAEALRSTSQQWIEGQRLAREARAAAEKIPLYERLPEGMPMGFVAILASLVDDGVEATMKNFYADRAQIQNLCRRIRERLQECGASLELLAEVQRVFRPVFKDA